MSRRSAFILLLLAAGIAIVVYAITREPHDFPKDKCPSCHVMDSAGNVQGNRLAAPVTALCEPCHGRIFKEGYLHPVNVPPRNVRIPADLPLSAYGQVDCNTCHDIHSSYFTPYGAPSHYLRRIEEGRKFCEACHEAASLRAGHAGTMEMAHFQPKYTQFSTSRTIDSLSASCISCHDGSFASSVSIKAGMWTHRNGLMRNDSGGHPIGIDYEGARVARGRRTDLRPMGVVDQRVRLFDGKVGCGSCHDPYSKIEKRLVMSDVQSRLCLSCHAVGRE